MTTLAPLEAEILKAYDTARASLPGTALGDVRDRAIRAFGEGGVPHRRVEAWKYTDLRKPLDRAVALADKGTALSASVPGASRFPGAIEIVFVNGFFRADLSALDALEEGIEVASFAALAEAGDDTLRAHLNVPEANGARAIAALNLALAADGAVIRIAPGAKPAKPLHLRFVGAAAPGSWVTTSTLVLAGAGSEAVIYESHEGTADGPAVANHGARIILDERARLSWIKLQDEADSAVHLADRQVTAGADAEADFFTLTTGAAVSRNETRVRFAGEGATVNVNGAYLLGGAQHGDNTTFIEHNLPGCRSNVTFKGVLDDTARGVFQGKALVAPHAQKTDARQLTKALMLSRTAEIDAKPELEIYADDVQCAHGSTAGEIDADALFYLQSRGIDEAAARALLVAAFVDEAIDMIADETAKETLKKAVAVWLGAHGEEVPDGV